MPAPSPTTSDTRRWRDNLQGELDGIAVYRAMAAGSRDASLVRLYERLAEAEERHAALWRQRLADAGMSPPTRPTFAAALRAWLARRLGPGIVLSAVASQERTGRTIYDDQPEAAGTALPFDERSHARLLREMTAIRGGTLARFEGRHRAVGGNALRAAVLGANDGLVSNFCLVMGVAGASSSGSAVLIAGSAGLLAGALSMALGEWLSVQSARELYGAQLAVEERELATFPEEEEEELRLIYEARGLGSEEARAMAHRLVIGPEGQALGVLASEELGIDVEELGGSPWVAATTSFVLFACGAIIPLAPFLFTAGLAGILISSALSGISLFLMGAGITVITGRNPLMGAFRQLAFGLVAAAVTFGIGTLVGRAIG